MKKFVNFITNTNIPKAMGINEIQQETNKDNTFQGLIKAIKHNSENCWRNPELTPYKKLRHELSEVNGIVLKGRKIILPANLQQKQ